MSSEIRRKDAKPKISKRVTGIAFLDQILGGGIPVKSIVCFLSDSVSGAEMFLYQFASVRKTYYITTIRRPEDITRAMDDLNLDTKHMKFVSADEAKYMLGRTLENIRASGGPDVNIIIDSFSFYLDAAGGVEKIRKLLDLIRDVTIAVNGITFLFVYKNTHSRDLENIILNTSDVIFDIEAQGEKRETILSIPKIRGMSPIGKVKVTLGDRIKIDTTRDIA